ncbi:hypothetical protein L198_02743 [Cryptococcus wingfieldii CBS 7118]|uniref:Uncharacterized protein n=1 Tax=Cryptococcus wingfieldii CBS 7118 TaxID=1295528 RepID=A0A1E3JQ15_9TREE|nr:hypothetical protein L198_02743 [Cryptococcus wingfieldii CBS 7118]ODO02012.1 hypothetical protein L198_02743 [Cryptococcus wingfieldii CBS 7118]
MFPLKMVLTFHAVLLFVKKWDCMLASNMMDMWLMELARFKHSHREIKPLDVFIIAAKADKVHAAEHVVLRYKRGPVTRPIGWHWSILPEDKDFEPLNLEVSAWEDIPVPYLEGLQAPSSEYAERSIKGVQGWSRWG